MTAEELQKLTPKDAPWELPLAYYMEKIEDMPPDHQVRARRAQAEGERRFAAWKARQGGK